MLTVFTAGATGATGRVFVPAAEAAGMSVRPHVRPASADRFDHPHRVVLDLGDAALVDALRGCDAVVCLVGTMRRRFHTGDTYATSDVGATRQLVDAAVQAGVPRFVLLSSGGAGRPFGPYLHAKAAAEAAVVAAPLRHTILRPSAFEDRDGPPLFGLRSVTRALGLRRYEPITLAELAAALVGVLVRGGPDGVLEGERLWAEVR